MQIIKLQRVYCECQTNTRIAMVIGVWLTGHPAAISATLLARDWQKCVCPHGTSAIESLSWFDETDVQQSSGAAEAADAEDAAVAADVEEVEADR